MAMIAMAAKNLYGTEEKFVVRILYPFNVLSIVVRSYDGEA